MMLDGLDHPKTLDLSARLDVCTPQVIGHLELLWAFVAKHSPRGDIGKWPNGAIARAAQWMGDAHLFVNALHAAGFVDASDEFRFIVHDWPDHCPRYVKAKLSKSGENFAINDCSGHYSADCSGDSKPCHAMPCNEDSDESSAQSDESHRADDADSPVERLPLNDNSEYPVMPSQVDEWRRLFPAVDVDQQLRSMRAWLQANTTRRKTRKGIKRFITNWLSREQDNGGSKNSGGSGRTHGLSTSEKFWERYGGEVRPGR